MFPVLKSALGQGKVGPDWRDHGDRVDISGLQQFRIVKSHMNVRIRPLSSSQGVQAPVTNCDNLDRIEYTQVSYNVGTPITIPYNAKSNHIFLLQTSFDPVEAGHLPARSVA